MTQWLEERICSVFSADVSSHLCTESISEGKRDLEAGTKSAAEVVAVQKFSKISQAEVVAATAEHANRK